MQIPPGLSIKDPNLVCRLQRSLYGLKQTSRQWFTRLSSFLISHGFRQSTSDHSLFLRFTDNVTTALLVYVDDIILTSNNIDEIQSITALLDQTFKIKDLGNLKFFLGLEIARTAQGILYVSANIPWTFLLTQVCLVVVHILLQWTTQQSYKLRREHLYQQKLLLLIED